MSSVEDREPPVVGGDGPSRREVVLELLIAYRLLVMGGIVAVIVAAVYFAPSELPSVPRWAKVFLLAFAGVGLLATVPALRIVAWLYNPSYTYLVDLDSASDELAVWELSPSAWRSLEVVDGELWPVRCAAPAWECSGYDPEEHVAEGYWKGSMSDLELAEHEHAVGEVRGTLEELADSALGLRVRQSAIVRSSVRRVFNSIVATFELESLPNGEAVERAIDRELEGWSMTSERRIGEAVGDDGEMSEPSMASATEFHFGDERDGIGAPSEVADD